MAKKRKEYDFLKIVQWISFLLIIVISTSFAICFFVISIINKETSKYADSVVLSYVRETQQLLNNMDNTMASEIMYDSNLETIQLYSGELKAIQAARTVKNLLVAWAHQNSFPTNYMVYFERTDESISGSKTDTEYIQWRRIREDLIEIVKENLAYNENSDVGDWNVIQIQGESYIAKYYHYNQRYICTWIKISDYINTLVMEGLGEQCYFVLSDVNGIPHNNYDKLVKDKVTIPAYMEDASIIRNIFSDHIIIQEPLKGTSFYMNAVIKDYSEVASILKVQIILICIVGLIAILCLAFMLYIRKTVIKPIQVFSKNIKKLGEDNSYSVETHYQISELENASELLADFVKQIKGLKIDIYERTLEQQKIQLDFLSVQIKPHFFLNCLNIIYHLVQIEKYKEVQHLTECVSSYLRYIFKNKENMVKFGEELKHIRDYLDIQKIRNGEGFKVDIQVCDEILGVKIIPLLIQTFIENALKHTIDYDNDIKITLVAKKISIEEEEFLLVIIEDTGDGFDKDILYKLQNHIDISEGEKKIGIMNSIQRMNLQYGEKAKITFYNRATSGAGIRMEIPMIENAMTISE